MTNPTTPRVKTLSNSSAIAQGEGISPKATVKNADPDYVKSTFARTSKKTMSSSVPHGPQHHYSFLIR